MRSLPRLQELRVGPAVTVEDRFLAGRLLPPSDRAVNERGLDLDRAAATSQLLSGQNLTPRSVEGLKNDRTVRRVLLHRNFEEARRLARGVERRDACLAIPVGEPHGFKLRRPVLRLVTASPPEGAGLVLPSVVAVPERRRRFVPDHDLVEQDVVLLPRRGDRGVLRVCEPQIHRRVVGDVRQARGVERIEEHAEILDVRLVVERGPVLPRRLAIVAGSVHAVVGDRVWTVCGEQRGLLAVHQPRDIGRARRVAAEEPVVAQRPEVAESRDWIDRRLFGPLVVHFARGCRLEVREQLVDLRRRRSPRRRWRLPPGAPRGSARAHPGPTGRARPSG